MTALVKSEVEDSPPISLVLTFPSVNTSLRAFEIWSANLGSPKYLNIITELNNMEVGFAIFLPAIVIPECGMPCENKALSFPMQAPGVIPTPPVIPEFTLKCTCADVRNDRSIKVWSNHDIELRRVLYQLHGAVIDDHLFVLNERIFL